MRAVYDKQGKESMEKVAQGGMDDPAGFFAAVFGGERFYDYVRISSHPYHKSLILFPPTKIGEISLMKEMTSVASAMMTEEEKEELERELNKQTPTVTPAGETPSTPPDATTSSSTSTTPHEPTDGPAHVTPAPESAPESGPAPNPNGAPTTPTQASRPLSSALTTSPGEGPTPSQSGTSTPKPTTEGRKGKSKLTPEQKQKIDEIAAERDEAMIKRVAELTDKLKERLRPFVEAHEPGGKNDPETQAFEARMKREADDLKLESFGVEVRWLGRAGVLILITVITATTHDRYTPVENIPELVLTLLTGNVYIMKGSSFLKSKKFLGMCVAFQ